MIAISNHNPAIRCYVNGSREILEEIDVYFNNFRFQVPSGFLCDGSSIPRFFWRIVGSPTTEQNLLAGIMHDYLYRNSLFPRDLCDLIYYEALLKLKKTKWQAWLMWKAVRLFGKAFYKKK